jgi:hypothetical protein
VSATFAGLIPAQLLCDFTTGAPVPGGAWTLYQSDGVTAAVCYTDRSKATTRANSGTANSDGVVKDVYADPGRYVFAAQSRTYAVEIYPDPAEPPNLHATTHEPGGTDALPALWAADFTAAGDLLVGTGSGAYAAKTLGGALRYLRVNAAGTDLEYGIFPTFANSSPLAGPFRDQADATPALAITLATTFYYRFRSTGTEALAGLTFDGLRANSNDRITVGLYADSANAPAGQLAVSAATVLPSAVATTTVSFASAYAVSPATDYWLAVYVSSTGAPTLAGMTMTAALARMLGARVMKQSGAPPATATPVALAGTEVLAQVWVTL